MNFAVCSNASKHYLIETIFFGNFFTTANINSEYLLLLYFFYKFYVLFFIGWRFFVIFIIFISFTFNFISLSNFSFFFTTFFCSLLLLKSFSILLCLRKEDRFEIKERNKKYQCDDTFTHV